MFFNLLIKKQFKYKKTSETISEIRFRGSYYIEAFQKFREKAKYKKQKRKKMAIMILVLVLTITVFVSAFARPVAQCPECNGEYYSTKVIKDWHNVRGEAVLHNKNGNLHYDGSYWKEREVAIVCSNGTHKSYTKKGLLQSMSC